MYYLYYKNVYMLHFRTCDEALLYILEAFLPGELDQITVEHGKEVLVVKDKNLVLNDDTPNPGSAPALARGCTCPVIDNGYGRGFMVGGSLTFWYNADCPVHAGHEEKNNA